MFVKLFPENWGAKAPPDFTCLPKLFLPALIIIIITIISIALYLTDKGEHTMLYKIYKNAYVRPPK